MIPVKSIKEPGIELLIKEIAKSLVHMAPASPKQVLASECSYLYDKRPFDLAKIQWYFTQQEEDFCGPIWGGIEYLKHIPTCNGCLTSLKIDMGQLMDSPTYRALATEIATDSLDKIILDKKRGN